MASAGARPSIEYLCKLLHLNGITHVTPELLRRAKFAQPEATAPLVAAVHDIVLCHAAGWPPGHAASLKQLRSQLAAERVVEELSPEGLLVAVSYLLDWGCPATLALQLLAGSPLVQQLSSPTSHTTNLSATGNPLSSLAAAVDPQISSNSDPGKTSSSSSRCVLLVFCWLVAHCQLFQRHLQQLALPEDLHKRLPPYPQDTSQSPTTQAAYNAALHASQQRVAAEQRLWTPAATAGRPTAAAAAAAADDASAEVQLAINSLMLASAGHASWSDVEAAAQAALRSATAAQSKLRLLTGQLLARDKLMWRIHALQQQQPQQAFTVSGVTAAPPMTPYELQLLANKTLREQHQQALDVAVQLLEQQLQCIQHAQTFFAWSGSVLAEQKASEAAAEQKALSNSSRASSKVDRSQNQVPAKPAMASRSHAASGGAANHPGSDTRVTPVDLVPLAQQLPPSCSAAAGDLLDDLQQQLWQLQSELSAAGAGAGSSGPAPPASTFGKGAAGAGAASTRSGSGAAAGGSACVSLSSYVEAAAQALLAAGAAVNAVDAVLSDLPTDISASLVTTSQQQGGGAAAGGLAAGPVPTTSCSSSPSSAGSQVLVAAKFFDRQAMQRCLPAAVASAAAAGKALQGACTQGVPPSSSQHPAAAGMAPAAGSRQPLGAVSRAGAFSGAALANRTPGSPSTSSSSGVCWPASTDSQHRKQGTAGETGVHELQRLQQLAVAAARLLARVRAQHKQHLIAAAGQLQGISKP